MSTQKSSMEPHDQLTAQVLHEVLPYIKKHSQKIFVVKVGGEIMLDPQRARRFCDNILLLRSVGIKVVLCHGGGPQISSLMEKYGKEAVFRDGLRVTDEETLRLSSMVLLGEVNRSIVSFLNASGSTAIGLSGVDGRIIEVVQKDPELGYVGEIQNIQTEAIMNILEDGYIPVIASLGIDTSGQSYNINADTAAGEIAASLGAEKLIVLTNVKGIYREFGNENTFVSRLTESELAELVSSRTLSGGILPKIEALLIALQGGTKRVHIIDGRVQDAILIEIFTKNGIGTMAEKKFAEKQ